MQESAFRAASEKFATLSEGAVSLSKHNPDAMEKARLALDALNDAKASASSSVKELSRIKAQLGTLDQGFTGVTSTERLDSAEFQQMHPDCTVF